MQAVPVLIILLVLIALAIASSKDYYKILNVARTASAADIKRAYRKLMSEHHPDKLVAKGLPPEMMEMAKQKAQEIQKAYELIKEKKGFK